MNISNLTEIEWNLRVDLAAAFHLAVANNLHEAIANHFSVVLPDGQVSKLVLCGWMRSQWCEHESG